MRSRLLGLLVLTLIQAHPAAAQHASGAPEPRLITVTGEAEVWVVPDEVVLTYGIETSDTDLDAAKAQNDARVKELLALIKEHGVEPKHVQTTHLSIEPRYREQYERRDFVGFFVHKTVVVTLQDLTAFEPLLSAALKAGVNHVSGINFRTTEQNAHEAQARTMAIRSAKEKATAMAAELGEEIGRPHAISEHQISAGPVPMYDFARQEAASDSSTISPGQLLVTAQVTVSFELK